METAAQDAPALGRKQVRLKARPNLQITKLIQGGRAVYVVKEPLSLRFFHLEAPQHFVLSKMDGRHTLEDIRRAYEAEYRPLRLQLEEVEDFAQQLLQGGLVENDAARAEPALSRFKKFASDRFWARWLNLFYFKIPFANPDRFLGKLEALGRFLFHPVTFALGLVLALMAGAAILIHWTDFANDLPSYRELFTWHTVLYLGLTFLLIKVLHELGHGLCCKTYGGTVHEMGAVLLFFFPTLYCNVSDSWQLPEKWKRIFINAAGIWVELVLASLGVLLWRLTASGHPLHSFALNLILVCGVHTLLFNANPLMRFDGYFILSDWLEVPNLAQRAQRALRAVLVRWFGGDVTPDPIPGPRRLLLAYGAASLVYRCVVTAGMLWLFIQFMKGQQLPWLGVTLVALAVLLALAGPGYRFLHTLAQLGRSAQMKLSRSVITCGLLVFMVVLVFYVPFPFSVRGLGVVQVGPDALRRVTIPAPGGFLQDLHVRDGQRVRQGDVLAILHNPDLECQLRMNEAEQALRQRQQQAFVGYLALFLEFKASGEGYEEINHELHALAEQHAFLKDQKDALTLRAPCDGVVMQLPSWETRGKWIAQGEPFLMVGETSAVRVTLLVDPADRQRVEEGRAVRFLPHGSGSARSGSVSGVAPADSATIPAHLAGRVGGEVATRQDPLTKAEKPFAQHYLVSIQLLNADAALHPGVLGEVRIEAGTATLWWRLRRLVGSTFKSGI